METNRGRRKLLVASVGVAAVTYVVIACGGATEGTENPVSGNLPAPPAEDASQRPPTSGNLPAPPPVEAGSDAEAGSDSGDGGAEDGDAPDGNL